MLFSTARRSVLAAEENVPSQSSQLDRDGWSDAITDAFGDQAKTSDFLPLAEDAVRACPGDAAILCLAATAALFDGRADRAVVFLKRLAKRYSQNHTDHLLQALALRQQNRLLAARQLLERHDLTTLADAIRAFPGGWERAYWLSTQFDAIFEREMLTPGRRRPSPAKGKPAAKPAAKGKAKPKTTVHQGKSAPPSAPGAAPPRHPSLPRIDIDISFAVEFDLASLSTATNKPPEQDGAWHLLRERFAHLGLAQGFDELLCLPHLRGIETFWHQVETVRKVLKQFRGRVLLADEVGLGKTIEAGMVLKEYLLRGMAERVLVLTPASLVGQWREELETKFDVSCATTHDAFLRDDPDGFWDQNVWTGGVLQEKNLETAALGLAPMYPAYLWSN